MINNLLAFVDVLSTIGSILVAVLILLATITVHEFGHYIVGKIFKFKINEFAIGMGPALFKRNLKNGEVFSIRVLPLGGFCEFEGEDQDDSTVKAENEKLEKQQESENNEAIDGDKPNIEQKPQKVLSENAFNNKPPWQRILVLLAGATLNMIFALVIVIANFSIFGHTAYAPAEIRPDETAGYSLQKGDIITSIDGHFIYHSVDMISSLDGKKKNDIVTVEVLRDGKKEKVDVMLRCDVNPESLTDYSDVFSSLGVGTVPAFTTTENSQIPSGEYLLRFNDGEEYSQGTRIYDTESFFSYLEKFNDNDKVEIWMTTSDETDDDGRVIVELTIPEGFSEADKTDFVALKALFGIESVGYSYQVSTKNAKLSFGELLYRPFVYSVKTIGLTFKSLFGLFNGSVPLNSVTGPIGTISLTAQYATYGFNFLLEIAGLIGFSVAIFNLLPIPALDGARAVFVAIEWVRGKPINRNVEGMIHTVGLFLLLGVAIFFDILQFI